MQTAASLSKEGCTMQEAAYRYITQLNIAGIPFCVQHSYDFDTFLCSVYHTEEAPRFTLSVDEADRVRERRFAEEGVTQTELEFTAFCRKFATEAVDDGRILFHACAVEAEGKAYLLAAPSGTGKSTHAGLWLQCFGDGVRILNGDKPMLGFEQGTLFAYGTPFMGKEQWGYPGCVPVGGICFLYRSEQNTIRRIAPSQALPRMLQQAFRPEDTKKAKQVVETVIRMVQSVPVYELGCDISREAAELSYHTMVGRKEGEE